MKVVVAIDSFKGSMTSVEAGNAAGEGILRVFPDAKIIVKPIADGGEGTVDALIEGMCGKRERVKVSGPLCREVTAEYGIVGGTTAVMEMSAAAGITQVTDKERNPLNTTTFGVGEMIKDAINKGCRNFLMGIGGSATNDGGIGMLQALGFDILDKDKKPVSTGGKGLAEVCYISGENAIPELSECTFKVACDVENPLCGKTGCSAIFGPQKGATPEMIKDMDLWLSNYADIAQKTFPKADKDAKGAGAAGGMGFALMTFLNAKLEKGIELILNEIALEDEVKDADFVITGEGRLDGQTVMGKAPVGVAAIAKKYNIPVIAFAGGVTPDAKACNQHGIDAFFPIVRGVCTLADAMENENARRNMADTCEQVFRIIK